MSSTTRRTMSCSPLKVPPRRIWDVIERETLSWGPRRWELPKEPLPMYPSLPPEPKPWLSVSDPWLPERPEEEDPNAFGREEREASPCAPCCCAVPPAGADVADSDDSSPPKRAATIMAMLDAVEFWTT